jgi:SAM-dependent methyltransferase
MTPQEATPAAVAALLTDGTYLRERRAPDPADPSYLHLRDLLAYLQRHRHDGTLRVLDFGSGGSPYRELFPQARFQRADVSDTAGVDLVIDARGGVAAPGESFDLVLSTQVLEHVPAPLDYLRECHRLLVPGGRLVLTTHGAYEEHGCPGDYHRWTADGLRHLVESAGFTVTGVHKLTCGGRALLQLLSHHQGSLYGPRWHPFGLFLALIRAVVSRARAPLHRWSDRVHASDTVVPAAEGHVLCLGLGLAAEKPQLER